MAPTVKVPHRDLFIGGKWTKSVQGKRLDVINPATEEVIGSIPAGTKEDVDKAIAAAKVAHKSGVWRNKTGAERAEVLRAVAKGIRERKDELAALEAIDCGKPIEQAEGDMAENADLFDYYADLAEKLQGRTVEPLNPEDPTLKIVVRREPLGVIATITPWNYPSGMHVWKVAPILAAGNTCVCKPSELASVTCLELCDIMDAAGLPAGVLNLITGLGTEAGAPLSSSKEIAKVAFTGSVATGSIIGQAAIKNMRPASMELGGKSAIIVFEDADIPKAVEWVMFGIFANNGQVCSATSRLLLQESIAEEFYKQLKARTETIKISDPLDEECKLGPLVSEGQYNKVLGYIESAKAEGAKVLTGGGKAAGFKKGYYVAPTVFTDVLITSKIWREEVFGPVLASRTFKTEEEAVAIANDSEYGLAAAVISSDPERCERVAVAMETGIVFVNNSNLTEKCAPWGGVKNSGYGRDLGPWGLESYLTVKQVCSYVSDEKFGFYPATV